MSLSPTLLTAGASHARRNATNGNTFFVGLPRRKSLEERRMGLAHGLAQLTPVAANRIGLAVIDGEGRVLEQRSHARDELWTQVVGRHGSADLFIRYPAVSLRHLFLFHRPGSDSVTVFDLRSGSGTTLLTGQSVVRAKLRVPFVLGCGDVWLVVGTTFEQGMLPCLLSPEAPADKWLVQMDRYTLDATAASADTSQRMIVEHDIIFGRSERCDAPCNWQSHPSDLSRVHALFFADGEHRYVVDTASSGGVRHVHDGPVRLRRVVAGDVYWLGRQLRVSFERMSR